jgi:hypothetical protein
MRRLYIAWDAGFGAPWFTDDLSHRFKSLLGELITLRDALNEERPNAQRVVETLNVLAEDLPTAKAQLREAIAGHDPGKRRNAEIASQEALIEELQQQEEAARHRYSRAKAALLTAMAHKETAEIIRGHEEMKRTTRQKLTEAQDSVEQAKHRLEELQEGRPSTAVSAS